MKVQEEKENPGQRPRCENEGCGKPAAAESRFCETCCLEWTLFRRDARQLAGGRR